MQCRAQLTQTAMLMTLTERKRKPDLHRQCLCVCVCACMRLWKTDHHDITVSTGNHVSKTLVFHSVAYLIHNSLLALCLSVPHSILHSGSGELNQFNYVFQCRSHQQKGWSHISFACMADDPKENYGLLHVGSHFHCFGHRYSRLR